MGTGASKKTKKTDKDDNEPPTFTIAQASAPPYNPECPPQGLPPQHPQPHPTHLYPGGQPPGTYCQACAASSRDGETYGPNEYFLETPSIEVLRTKEHQVNEEALRKYFSSNKKSHGGQIASMAEDDDCFVINFENFDVAREVLSHSHELDGTQLHVRNRKSPTIEVITDGTIAEDRLKTYFENRRNGGGPIDGTIKKTPQGVFYITFKNKRAAIDVVQKPSHSIDGKEVAVAEKLSLIDRRSLLIKGIPAGCSRGHLRDYLEGKDSKGTLHIAGVYLGDDESVAVVSLFHDIDGETRHEIGTKAKQGDLAVSVSPMVVTRSVQLSGITKQSGITRDLLLNYFENTERSGGGKVLDINMDKKKGTAIISFKDPAVVQRVVQKPFHQFDCGSVSVCPHFSALGTVTDTDFLTSSKTPFDPDVHRVIKRNELNLVDIQPSKLRLLEKQLLSIKAEFPNVDVDIDHDHHKITIDGVDHETTQARDNLNEKLQEFKEYRWSISDELQYILSRDNAKKVIERVFAEANVQNGALFSVENNEVLIVGVDKSTVRIAESCVRSTFKETSRNIPKQILILSDWDHFVKRSNDGAKNNAKISYDKTSGKVKIVGLIREVGDIDGKLEEFLKQHSFETSFVDLERPIVYVLVKRQKDQLRKIELDNDVSIDDMGTRFKIQGPKDRMKKVSDEIKGLASKVIETTAQYKKPGLAKLFNDDTFKKLLKGIEENKSCALRWDCETWTPSPRGKATLKGLRPSKPSPDHGGPKIGHISVHIEQGNIESETADVIVNPVTDNSAFTVVGDALSKAGGPSVKGNFNSDWSKRLNGVVLSDAGTLQCKKVAHMELPPKHKLKDAVCQCLVLSTQAGMTSIAFPAIGTGNYGMTSIESAKAIRDGIEQFIHQNPNSSLKHVKLTIFLQKMVRDYEAEFRSPMDTSSAAGITTPSPGQQEMSFGSIKMQVQQGDICKEGTDVLVSAILKDMKFTAVTNALVKAGGQSIADELKIAWPNRTGKVVFTGAGTLPSKKVAHMVLPSSSELMDSVVSCLRTADQLGMTSIAFPAIGTGGTMSQVESASGIYSGVQEFSSQCNPKSLQLVRVTVFDNKTLGPFHSTMQQYTTTSHIPRAPLCQIGSVAVEIQHGDLAKETTDAIVNPVNTDGGFFAVGNALEKVGGATIRTECKTSWNQRQNEVLLTDGGTLPCKKVIHAVCPNANVMKGRVLECLLRAEGRGLASVSFPAIGTGGFGVSVADAARETILGIRDFAITHSPSKVKLVRVTVFQQQMVAEFQQALKASLPKAPIAPVPKPSIVPVAPAPPAAKISPKSDVEQAFEVKFYACNKRDMDNAKQEVSQTIDSYMTRGCVDDDRLKATIRHLEENEKDSIIQMGADNLALVTITGHNIEMVGLKDDVAEVRRIIESFLREKLAAYELEKLEKHIIKVPDYWAPHPTGITGAYMYKLDASSPEYQDVERSFLSSVGYQPQIVSISRVQNEAKYKAYISELQERRKTCPRSKIEELLYHGTAEEVVDNINQGGFNRSYCGKNATAYGKGVYFAKSASYSAQATYSPPDTQGNKYIYQARVIVGEYTTGRHGMLEPPAKNPANAVVRFDSVVDNMNNPSIFVVFHDNDAYPEYLIVFK
ncbi:protein mono-ADP-ribosyltransferase PARP14-like isoform X2 [Branchiostoma floridae]|uniref:Poly [ADP-ribose] polymerase n=1 Tax=Branchiostoma floridae TaxID=7739 RepID=A0A9J7HP30_BRAFL|nr:protein mono-ADP-ribosyltransferase PARP14-like isoform X2 [Branchiostoma floridae]